MSLATRVLSERPENHRTPVLAVAIPEGDLPASLQKLDQKTRGALSRLMAAGDFRGKPQEIALVYPEGAAQRILLAGLGKVDALTPRVLRRTASVVGKRIRQMGVERGAFHLASEALSAVPARAAAQAIVEGVSQGAWYFGEMKRPPEDQRAELEEIALLAPAQTKEFEAGQATGAAIAAGQAYTRGVQVLPGNLCTPAYLAGRAEALGQAYGFTVTVLDRAAMEREGMGGVLGVAQGSAQEPRFITLEYQGAPGDPIVLVGKGVTFDSGGISIKPAANMEDMKYDMSGAAAVLGAFEMLGRLQPKVHVVGLIPSAENMPSGSALKPGDVITASNGKTIEIINTDAEGRLLLADALSWARRLHPACVIDAATLTGAIVIALGHSATGVMGTSDELIEELRRAGDRAGEPVWPLPLWEDYRDLMKSDIADVKNSGGRPAGSISAGWFLREFVEGYPWAHLDIAGTAWTDRDMSDLVRGPTGVGVRLFCEFILGRAAAS